MACVGRSRRCKVGVEGLEGRAVPSGALATAMATATAHRAAEVAALGSARGATPSRWAWLARTYWYVPTPNLPATIFDPSTGLVAPVRDQTVYHITGYRGGYFWGITVSQLGQGAPASSALVGSVTPQGRLLLTFTSTAGVVQGYGTMTRKKGIWTMENQMFTTMSGVQVGHWAYMVPTRPGLKSWASLPSAGVSVPAFLANYSGPVPTPIAATRDLAR